MVVLLDGGKPGHTSVVVTNKIEVWIDGSDPSTAAASIDCLDPNSAWRAGVIICAGTSEPEANRIMQLISTNAKGKQVRGATPRGARADVISTLMHKSCFMDRPLIFNISPEEFEKYLEVCAYKL